ncbi:MAG TPA: rRNA maturation RNase YbeY [Candidatus Eisenbacteria bacterium]|nr:rRNA maturation RNase YbeY [Candidatus Eisenbacteria bacterium]
MVTLKKKITGLSAASLQRFILRARKVARLKGTVDVLITSSGEMRSLNDRFRGKDKPTDVLSFPSESSTNVAQQTPFAGEIAISADIALDNARRLGHPAAAEVKVLVLHGILHLAGFDHERDNGRMARKEAILRSTLRLPSSLTERSNARSEMRTNIHRRVPGSKTAERTA